MRQLLKKIRPDGSVFHSWLLSYALIIGISLAVSVVLYFQASAIISEESGKAHSALLKQVAQELDTRLEEIERLSMQLLLNARLQVLFRATPPVTENQQFKMYELTQDFRAYDATNGFISGFYIYFPNLRTALAHDGIYSDNRLYELFHSGDLELTDWQRMVASRHSRDFVSLSGTNAAPGSRTYGYLQSYPLGTAEPALANLVVLVKESRIRQMLDNIDWVKQGVLLVADKYNRIITASSDTFPNPPIPWNQLSGAGVIYPVVDGKPMVVSYYQSARSGWTYAVIAPQGALFNNVELIRRFALLNLLLGLAASGLAALYFARRNYNPIRGLLELFPGRESREQTGKKRQQHSNEYHVIREMISRTLSEQTRMTEELSAHQTVLRDSFLTRLIKGRTMGTIPIHESLSAFNMRFETDQFSVLALQPEHYGKLTAAPDPEESRQLTNFILKNVVEELFNQRHLCWTAEMDDLLVCLINHGSETDAADSEEWVRLANAAQLFVQEKFGIRFTATIGQPVRTLKAIPQSYAQAIEALEHKFVMGGGQVIVYKSLDTAQSRYYYPLEKEQQLINSVKIGDIAASEAVVEEIFTRNLSAASLSSAMVKCLIFDMTSTVIKTLDELGLAREDRILEEINPVDRLVNCESVFQMKEQMSETLRLVCGVVESRKKSRNTALKDEVDAFVNEHYVNQNLSITWIADRFHMNASYLSRFYKEQSGESLVDCINKKRIAEAKRWMKESDLTINDIAERVGYSSSIALIRTFKRYEGITPGKYKELLE